MRRNRKQDVIYVHLNEKNRFVLSSGIFFNEFVQALNESINHILLLKHRFDDADFNLHTLLDYIPQKRVMKLAGEDVSQYGDFCWIDFEEMEGLDEIPGQVLAELLYLGHMKEPLRAPFYNYLGNRFTYLAIDDGWFNKTYYRNLNDFYRLLGELIPMKLDVIKPDKSLLGLKRKKVYPVVDQHLLHSLKGYMSEGMVLSLREIVQNRHRIEIPMWVIGDFSNMDDMHEEYEKNRKRSCDAKLIFDKKSNEWKIRSS
ncbi:hypothetical protein R4Z10_01435 [Niallia sp. XMNu-256]|uniref:hypothetical protein n=1 Tax=Niallia sp. XMNu-256 TaxID=3082444 RepID=UPI0030D362F8